MIDFRLFLVKTAFLGIIPGTDFRDMFLQKIRNLGSIRKLRIRQYRHPYGGIQNMYDHVFDPDIFFVHLW